MAVALATALAVTVKAVWGTSLGIKGTSLRPSMDHSEELFGPDMLKKKKNGNLIRGWHERKRYKSSKLLRLRVRVQQRPV